MKTQKTCVLPYTKRLESHPENQGLIKWLRINCRKSVVSKLCISVFFAIIMPLGWAYDHSLSAISFLSEDASKMAIAIAIGLLAFVGVYFAATVLWSIFDKSLESSQTVEPLSWRSIALILLAFWLPWYVACLPGLTSGDGYVQLTQWLGGDELTNHHPILVTAFFGKLYSAGKALGGPFAGIATISGVQMLIMASCLATSLYWLSKTGVPRRITYCCIAFFALFPLIPQYAIVVEKDSLSAAIGAVFFVQVTIFVWCSLKKNDLPSFCKPATMIIIGLLYSLSRHNCIYIALVALVVAALFLKHESRRNAYIVFASILSGYLVWTLAFLPAYGIRSGHVREALSLPLQQIAYAVYTDADSLTSDERDWIEKETDRKAEELADAFNENLSDPVKNSFFQDSVNMAAFFRTYLSIGIKHPVEYTDYFLRALCSYTDPFYAVGKSVGSSRIGESPDAQYEGMLNGWYSCIGEVPELGEPSPVFPKAKQALKSAVGMSINAPIIGILFMPGFFSLLLAICGMWSLMRKQPASVLVVSSVLNILVCVVSPQLFSIRYFLPVLLLTPIVLAACFIRVRD